MSTALKPLSTGELLGTSPGRMLHDGFRARTCIQRDGPYESAGDGLVVVLVFCVTSKYGYRQSLYKDSSGIPTLH